MAWMVKLLPLPTKNIEKKMLVQCPVCNFYTKIDMDVPISSAKKKKNVCLGCGAYLSASERLCFFRTEIVNGKRIINDKKI